MGIAQELAFEFRWLLPQFPLKDLSAFSGNLATCLKAGLNVPDCVETCTRSSPNTFLRSAGQRVADKTRQGATLSEALEEMAKHLPGFYLPVLRCGEQSGRTDEALHYLQEHCALLEKPSQLIRSLWFVPLVLYVVSSAVLILAYFLLMPFFTATAYLVHKVTTLAVLAAVALIVLNVAPVRPLWEQLLLALPVIGPAIRLLAVNRFLHAFNLLYCTGGMSMARMVCICHTTVGNMVVGDEFLTAIPLLEEGKPLSESLARCQSLTYEQKHMIHTGEEAGRIEDALNKVCSQASESLKTRLKAFGAIYFRVVGAIIIVGTLLTLRSLLMVAIMR